MGGNPSQLATALWMYGWVITPVDAAVAEEALEESVELARRGASSASIGAALGRLAPVRARRGDRRGALDALRDSVALSSAVTDHVSVGASMCLGMITLGALGVQEPVAVVAGARRSGTIVANISSRESEAERDAAEHARASLGARALELERRGAAMSYDEVVAYLLAELDALIAMERSDG